MRRLDPALLVVLGGVSAALHVGKLPTAIPVLRDALGVTLVQAGFLLSLVQLADKLAGGQAALWCLCMVCVATILAFFAGRMSVRWRAAERVLQAVGY
jgi:hypothetical protein